MVKSQSKSVFVRGNSRKKNDIKMYFIVMGCNLRAEFNSYTKGNELDKFDWGSFSVITIANFVTIYVSVYINLQYGAKCLAIFGQYGSMEIQHLFVDSKKRLIIAPYLLTYLLIS